TNTGTFVDVNDTGSNPALADTDGDGFDDGLEVALGSDPNVAGSVPVPGLGPLPALLLVSGLALVAGRGLRHRRSG
ncbi:MAG: MarR family transcriptional regulator, partial [Myxococcota bacterium]